MAEDRDEFTEALEMELRLRGFAFQRWQLTGFVRSAWPLIAEDPCPRALGQGVHGGERGPGVPGGGVRGRAYGA